MSEPIMVFHITIKGEDITHMESDAGQVTVIPFGGTVESDYFTGEVRPGAADVQVTNAAGIRHMCAQYIFTGKDADGNACCLFVSNNGYFEPNSNPSPFHACPTFMTDSRKLGEYLHSAHFRAEGWGAPQGVDIRIYDVLKD